MELILASTSKYRQELLNRLGIPFQAIPPICDEDAFKSQGLSPQKLAETLAFEKAKSISSDHTCVIGGDQVAVCKGQILGKPGSAQKARETLKLLSASDHELITSICVMNKLSTVVFTDITKIRFRKLSDTEIENYILLDQPFDCAASYKMEKAGITLVESINCDDFTAIQGIPLIKLSHTLRELGFTIPSFTKT